MSFCLSISVVSLSLPLFLLSVGPRSISFLLPKFLLDGLVVLLSLIRRSTLALAIWLIMKLYPAGGGIPGGQSSSLSESRHRIETVLIQALGPPRG